MLGWSSVGQYKAEVKKADDTYGPIYDKYLKMDLKAVAADKEANEMGKRLFLTYCSQCHGSDARGSRASRTWPMPTGSGAVRPMPSRPPSWKVVTV